MSAITQGYTRSIGNCFQSFINSAYQRIETYDQQTPTLTKIKQVIGSIIGGLIVYAVLSLINVSLPFGITHLQWGIGSMVSGFALFVLGFRLPCENPSS